MQFLQVYIFLDYSIYYEVKNRWDNISASLGDIHKETIQVQTSSQVKLKEDQTAKTWRRFRLLQKNTNLMSETSFTRDTRKKAENESTSSLFDRFSVKKKNKIYTHNFTRNSSNNSIGDVHLDILKKTVNSLHWQEPRVINSRERDKDKQRKHLNAFSQVKRSVKVYRKVNSMNNPNPSDTKEEILQ